MCICKFRARNTIMEESMKKTTFSIVSLALAAACVLSFSGIALARGAGNYGGCPGYAASGLTPEQQTKAQQICTAQNEKMTTLRQQMIAKQAELQVQMVSATPDKAKIESISKELGELRGKMLVARTEISAQLQKEGIPMNKGFGMGHGKGRGMHGGMGSGCNR